MRSRVVLASVVVSLLTAAHPIGQAEAADGQVTAQIVGGSVAAPDAWPFAAQVIIHHPVGLDGYCTGALIDPSWVLTAGHCVSPPDGRAALTAGSRVLVGSRAYDSGPSYGVAEFKVSPDYVSGTELDSGNDFALIHLASPSPVAAVALVSTTELDLTQPGQSAVMIGWGVTAPDGSGPSAPLLKQGDLTIIDPTSLGYHPHPNEIWAKGPAASACYGDSGGPLLVTSADGTPHLAGVVSGGNTCAVPLPPRESDYFGRVSNKLSWISSVVHPQGAPTKPMPTAAPALYQPISPTRILDTRSGIGTSLGRLSAGQTVTLAVAGVNGVPAGATAVAINLTAVNPNGSGYVTAYPCSSGPPNASSLNYGPGQTVANMVLAPLAGDGSLCLYVYTATDLVADVSGYAGALAASGFGTISPARVLDTRKALGAPGPVIANTPIRLVLAGVGGVPTNATAAVLNVTATETSGDGFVTAFPCGQTPPNASSLNYRANQTVPNLVVAPLASDGSVCLTSFTNSQLLADVSGWFGPSSTATLTPLAPTRVMDTRVGLSATRLPANSIISIDVRNLAGLDVSTVAVALNVTVTDANAAGFVTVYACGQPVPSVSNLNYVPGQTVPNLVLASLPANGTVCLYAYTAVDLVADITGAYR